VQLNWTGPNVEDDLEWLNDKKAQIKSEMELDAENLNPLVQGVQWLLLARAIFVRNFRKFSHFKVKNDSNIFLGKDLMYNITLLNHFINNLILIFFNRSYLFR
jgi:hypothetical protein